jgi:hypothetical protein
LMNRRVLHGNPAQYAFTLQTRFANLVGGWIDQNTLLTCIYESQCILGSKLSIFTFFVLHLICYSIMNNMQHFSYMATVESLWIRTKIILGIVVDNIKSLLSRHIIDRIVELQTAFVPLFQSW